MVQDPMCARSAAKRGHKTRPKVSSVGAFDDLIEVISRSQRNYRELIDHLDHALFTLSIEGEVRVANLCAQKILGVPFKELIGHRLTEFVESPSFDKVRSALPAFTKQSTWTGVVPLRFKKDGALRYFNCGLHAHLVRGQVASVTGWARDITAQLESEVRFTDLFESLREGILFTSLEGQILDANPAFVRMLGYTSKEELQAVNIRELYDDPSHRDTLISNITESGVLGDFEIVFRRKDGKRVHCLSSASAIRDSAGRIHLQGMIEDVTELRETQKKLQAEQKFVRPLMESFPNVIAAIDGEGRVTFVNERLKGVLGVEPDALVGEQLGACAHPEDQSALAGALRSVFGGKQRYTELEFRLRHADGSWRTVLGSFGPSFDEWGTINGIVATARDVTHAKLMEEQLARSERYAAMGQMLAGAAHELNNPLTAILGISDLLKERATDDSMRRHAEMVFQQARRAAAIVQDLLVFSRPRQQKRPPVRMADILQQVLQSQRGALDEKHIRVNLNASRDLPAVEGDTKLLEQMLQNIVVNAVQAISAVRDQGTLDISLSRRNDYVCVSIADNGPGIAPEHIRKIFDPFFTTKRPGGGSGLGLTISMVVVKDHGGRIEVDSTPGQGAAFRILLPILPAIPALDTPVLREKENVSLSPQSSPRRAVLVVDDEEGILEITRESLLARGVSVQTAKSAEQAFSNLAAGGIDIVVCDINLPGLSGEQLFEQLRARAGDSVPSFVFMTGDYVDRALSERLRQKGAAILQKPFHVSELASLIAKIGRLEPSKAH